MHTVNGNMHCINFPTTTNAKTVLRTMLASMLEGPCCKFQIDRSVRAQIEKESNIAKREMINEQKIQGYVD